jgi:hypothetical protein
MSVAFKWLLVASLAALPILILVGGELLKPQESVLPEATPGDAIHFSKELMKQSVRLPAKTIFPEADGFEVEKIGEKQWRVSSYLETPNAFGDMIRMPFELEIEEQQGRWKLLERKMEVSPLTKAVREGSWTKGRDKPSGFKALD